MLDKWFVKEVEKHFRNYNRLLFVDKRQEYEFLIHLLDSEANVDVFYVQDIEDDLKTKYKIERSEDDKHTLIYSTLPQEELHFCREYGATNETPESLRKSLSRFIQSKLDFTLSGLDTEDYRMLGKESLERGIEFWKDVKVNGVDAVLGNFNRNLVEFLSNPKGKHADLGEDVWDVFCKKIESFAGLTAGGKPPRTLAEEFLEWFFSQFLDGEIKNKQVSNIYEEWIRDSKTNQDLEKCASEFLLPNNLELWKVAPDHPFKELDKNTATEVINNLGNKDWVREHAPFIRKRLEHEDVLNLIGVDFWGPLQTFSFPQINTKAHEVGSLEQFINDVYPEELFKLDQADRQLYIEFEEDKEVKKRIEEYYIGLMKPYWDEWFSRFNEEYEAQQAGMLEQIFDSAEGPCAVIVGDGLSFELADEIAGQLSETAYEIDLEVTPGSYPSTTENNKSVLFDESGKVERSRRKREDKLSDTLGENITAINLSDYKGDKSQTVDNLILYQNDTDDILEKLSTRGLKYLEQCQQTIKDSIQKLLNSGYEQVHVVSDHGFVLYGSIEDADKIPVDDKSADTVVRDRFVASKKPLDPPPNNSVHLEANYRDYKHLYFANGLTPYMSPSEYGYAHGGISPQELLTPHLKVTTKTEVVGQQLRISISNKEDLHEVPIANPTIILKAESADELLDSTRRIYLEFRRGGEKFKDTNVITISSGKREKLEVKFDEKEDCSVLLLDADTKKTLDKAEIHFESARDLGGLMDG